MNRQRGDQYVAPDALVFHQLGDEPAEAERFRLLGRTGSFLPFACILFLARHQQYVSAEQFEEFVDCDRFRRFRSGSEKHQLSAAGLDEQYGNSEDGGFFCFFLFRIIGFGRMHFLLCARFIRQRLSRWSAQKGDCRERKLFKRCECLVIQVSLTDFEVQRLQCIEHCHARVWRRELLTNELRIKR